MPWFQMVVLVHNSLMEDRRGLQGVKGKLLNKHKENHVEILLWVLVVKYLGSHLMDYDTGMNMK